jgi:hypothetical protein
MGLAIAEINDEDKGYVFTFIAVARLLQIWV